jgi:hypothetical protein
VKRLTKTDRMRLMKFVCSFAWADLEVQEEERDYVGRLINALQLHPQEAAQVMEWLEVPPRPDEVDPQDVPREHRQLFLDTMRKLVTRDGVVDPGERENLLLFEQLLR